MQGQQFSHNSSGFPTVECSSNTDFLLIGVDFLSLLLLTASMSEKTSSAVRQYLLSLSSPEALVDEAAVKAAEKKVAGASDPLDKLLAISELEALRNPDTAGLRAEFVAVAKEFSDSKNISPASWKSMGVGDDVLREAGIISGTPKATPRSHQRTRVSQDEVRATIPTQGSFSLAQLSDMSGATTATVTKVVKDLVADGKVVELGPDKDHSGRGRAPMMYRKA